jgi:hypothetical protein
MKYRLRAVVQRLKCWRGHQWTRLQVFRRTRSEQAEACARIGCGAARWVPERSSHEQTAKIQSEAQKTDVAQSISTGDYSKDAKMAVQSTLKAGIRSHNERKTDKLAR